MGVTIEIFQASRTLDRASESLKIAVRAGDMESAVALSM